MDTDVSHAVKAELDKLHARIDNLIANNKLKEPVADETVATETEGQ